MWLPVLLGRNAAWLRQRNTPRFILGPRPLTWLPLMSTFEACKLRSDVHTAQQLLLAGGLCVAGAAMVLRAQPFLSVPQLPVF